MAGSGAATLPHFIMGFGQGGLCTCELHWVKLGGMGEERSGSGKRFKPCVDFIVHLHNLFNDCRKFWTVAKLAGKCLRNST